MFVVTVFHQIRMSKNGIRQDTPHRYGYQRAKYQLCPICSWPGIVCTYIHTYIQTYRQTDFEIYIYTSGAGGVRASAHTYGVTFNASVFYHSSATTVPIDLNRALVGLYIHARNQPDWFVHL